MQFFQFPNKISLFCKFFKKIVGGGQEYTVNTAENALQHIVEGVSGCFGIKQQKPKPPITHQDTPILAFKESKIIFHCLKTNLVYQNFYQIDFTFIKKFINLLFFYS